MKFLKRFIRRVGVVRKRAVRRANRQRGVHFRWCPHNESLDCIPGRNTSSRWFTFNGGLAPSARREFFSVSSSVDIWATKKMGREIASLKVFAKL